MKPCTGSRPTQLFVDTWAWIVLADTRDPAHGQVRELRLQCAALGGRWVTTDYVLDELITRLFSTRYFREAETFCDSIFRSARGGFLIVEQITGERFQSAYRLRQRYRDKPRISFTDLTSMAVMRELGIRHVVTGDNHFSQVHLGFQILP